MTLPIMLDSGAFMPVRGHSADAGMDLLSPITVMVPPRSSVVIDTGVHCLIPEGYAGVLMSKSGLNVKHDITSTGLVDAGYSGSIVCKLYNHGEWHYRIERGDKITQLVIQPIEVPDLFRVTSFPETERGDAGFGSTGR